MEVGQNPAGQHHYAKRWEGHREPFYSTEGWKDRKAADSWNDAGHGTTQSSSPTSLSSLLPIVGSDGSVDKVLYQNLVEMIPLVESFMDQQGRKSFPRHASLIYTPTPSRDPWLLKKGVDHSSKSKRNRMLRSRGKRVGLKDDLFWDNTDHTFNDNRETYAEEIPMLSFPTDHQVDQTAVNKAEIVQLQRHIEELEQKLQEKDSQLQVAEENSAQRTELLHLQTKVEGLQDQISDKEREIRKARDQLEKKQHEVVGLQSRLEKAQADVQASNVKAANAEEELNGLRCQVAALFFQMQNMSSTFDDDQTLDELENPTSMAVSLEDRRTMGDLPSIPAVLQSEVEQEELTRRKYLAAIIAARENPGEELLSLVAELRAQLQAIVMRPAVTTVASDLLGVQSSRFSLC